MPDVLLDKLPAQLYERIERLARARNQGISEMIVEMLEQTFHMRGAEPVRAVEGPPLRPDPPFLTDEIAAPFSIPWPAGETVTAIDCGPRLPEPHDLPDA